MNTIKVKVNFKRGTCETTGIKLITTDYASTKINFQFDDKSGTNIFTMVNPRGEIVYSDIIQNNELLLYKMADVTIVHNNVVYTEYIDSSENIYWYDPISTKLFTDQWVEVSSFDLDNYTKVQERASLFTMKGAHKFEISKYVNNSKLTSVTGSLQVRNNLVQLDVYAEPYLSVFDTAMNQINNVNIDGVKVDNVTTLTLTLKDGTTKSFQILDGSRGAQGVPGQDGLPGADGYSPIASVTQTQTGATISITDKTGTTTADVMNGEEYDDTEVRGLIAEKQNTLVSGSNIKTVNNQSLLGSGNIHIEGGTGTDDYSELSNKPSINNVTLNGNKSLSDLGAQPAGNYLTSESDPVFSASVAAEISSSDISAWNSKGTYSKPSGGIPSTDMSSAVQTSLGKADTALQSEDLSDYVKNNDYAGSSKGGTIKTGYGLNIESSGAVYASAMDYATYRMAANKNFISKGTLENVFTAKGFLDSSKISHGSADPSGGSDGDIYFKYDA